jgi:spore coat polysaccharide biosynthesis protein SpsF
MLMTKITDAAIVTVRNSSTRLPNKSIMQINNNIRTIDIVLERAKKTSHSVIIATSTDKSDDIFESIAREHGISIFRGSLLNKIKRWFDCFNYFEVENALLIDGDDLCYSYDIGKRAMIELKSQSMDMIIHPPDIITGLFTYAIKKSGIEKMFKIATNTQTNTDIITSYIEKADLQTNFVSLENYERNQNIRMTLDYKEDLLFFRKLYERNNIIENTKNIVDFLIDNENIVKINFHRQKDFLTNKEKFQDGL